MCKELELLRGEKGVHVVWRRGSVQGLESEPDEENAHAWWRGVAGEGVRALVRWRSPKGAQIDIGYETWSRVKTEFPVEGHKKVFVLMIFLKVYHYFF